MECQLWRRVVSTRSNFGRWFLGAVWLGFSVSTANASNCVENGGSMVCAAKEKFGTPWIYYMCDGSGWGGYTSAIRRQCHHWYDGEWVFRPQYDNFGCENEQNRPMTDPDDNSLLQRAMNYDRDGNTCDITATIRWATDDETAGYYWCWGFKKPKYFQGIEVSNMASLEVRDQHLDGLGECTGSETIRGIAVSRNRSVAYACPQGYDQRYYNDTDWECVRPINNSCDVGNPISPVDGCKTEVGTDYDGPGNGLTLTRHYSSLGYQYQPLGAMEPRHYPLGNHWHTNFDRRLFPISGSTHVMASVERPDGAVRYFRPDGSEVHNLRGNQERLDKLTDAAGETIGWRLLAADQSREEYGDAGRLQAITPRSGPKLTLTYSDAATPESVAPFAELLIAVTTNFGHALSFTYDAQGRMATMTDPQGRVTQYDFVEDNLTKVIYPDDTPGDDSDNPRRIYHYEDTKFPYHLTGITDGNGDRFATYAYDPDTGKAIVTEHAQTANAGPQERYALTYDSHTQTTITDADDTVEVLTFEENLGIKNLISRMHQSDGKGITQAFDANNNLVSRTDAEGRITQYTYSATNQRETMTEAVGTPEARTKSYEYLSPDVDLPITVLTPSVFTGADKEVVTAYDAKLNVTSITENGFTADGIPVSRTTSFQYNASGQVIQIDGPRSDVNDITTFTYYDDPACTTGNECGQLKSVSNALGHVTTYDTYDAHGRVTQMTDSLGLVTTYEYDARGRVLQVLQTPPAGQGAIRATTYTYYGVMDQVKTVTTPDGVTLTYSFDAAHDLRSITDNAGNSIEYFYDQKGNRIREDTKDPDSTLVRTVETAYDLRNRVASINATGSITQTIRDAVGNLVSETDPNLNPPTAHHYDALDRLDDTLDALGQLTDYGYDVHDRLIRVQSPNNATTTYAYDDLGNILQEISPDRGTTTYTHDAAGNITTITDARNITVTYTHDALNRVTNVDYPGTAEDITLTYDTCQNGWGRVCNMQDESGDTQYIYNAYGQVLTETRTVLGVAYTTSYYYYPGGQSLAVVDPSWQWVYFQRDAVGRVERVYASGPVNSLVADNRSYRADGLLTSQTFSNGLQETRDYDLNGRLLTQSLGTDTRSYLYDDNGNVLTIDTDPWGADYGYDALDRLDNEIEDRVYSPTFTATTTRSYGYDTNGNRESRIINGGTPSPYNYTPDSNRLTDFDGWQVTMQPNGHQVYHFLPFTGGGVYAIYPQNNAGRMAYAGTYVYWSGGYYWGQTNYRYNARGLRTIKTLNAASATPATTVYHYDLSGHLILETTDTGEPIRSYAWVGDTPILQRDHTGETDVVVYLHTDHLNTPRLASDANGTIVWRMDGDAFGNGNVDGNPDRDNQYVQVNLRFPGQYYDSETGLHYNWNRYYDPKTGRYITSDPIGLEGGLNTYLYVEANPGKLSDPLGLMTFMCRKPLDALGGSGSKSGPDVYGNPLYHQYLCIKDGRLTVCGGQDRQGGPWSPGKPSNDRFDKNRCEQAEPDNSCLENCLRGKFGGGRPNYGLFGPGTNCQEWSNDILNACRVQCGLAPEPYPAAIY